MRSATVRIESTRITHSTAAMRLVKAPIMKSTMRSGRSMKPTLHLATTDSARARAESLVEKCKVGFMERPERIVLFMIGAFTDRMAAVLWVILVLSIVTVADRIYYTYLVLNAKPMPGGSNPLSSGLWRAFFWRDERGTMPYDLWVVAILAFVWLTPPVWLKDPTASGLGVWNLLGF